MMMKIMMRMEIKVLVFFLSIKQLAMSVRPAALVHIHNSKDWGVELQKSRFSDPSKPLESTLRTESLPIGSYILWGKRY